MQLIALRFYLGLKKWTLDWPRLLVNRQVLKMHSFFRMCKQEVATQLKQYVKFWVDPKIKASFKLRLSKSPTYTVDLNNIELSVVKAWQREVFSKNLIKSNTES